MKKIILFLLLGFTILYSGMIDTLEIAFKGVAYDVSPRYRNYFIVVDSVNTVWFVDAGWTVGPRIVYSKRRVFSIEPCLQK